jgi:uncharacterized DUF497 family protein
MAPRFRWIDWNREHVAKHGVEPADAEYLVRHAVTPFPRKVGDEKFLVQGQDRSGRYLQVIYILSPAEVVFVIHARPLDSNEKRRFGRGRAR